MPGLCRRQGSLNGRQISHFADQNHVRVLTQNRTQTVRIGGGILADLPLVYEALVRRIDVFDRVLQRDDMPARCMVDPVEHRRQRGGLTGTRFACDQHQSGRIGRQLQRDRRQIQILDLRNHIIEQSDRKGKRTPCVKNIGSDSDAAVRGQRKIQLAAFTNRFKLCACKLLCQHLAVLRGRYGIGQGLHFAIESAFDRQPADDVQIGRAFLLCL